MIKRLTNSELQRS